MSCGETLDGDFITIPNEMCGFTEHDRFKTLILADRPVNGAAPPNIAILQTAFWLLSHPYPIALPSLALIQIIVFLWF